MLFKSCSVSGHRSDIVGSLSAVVMESSFVVVSRVQSQWNRDTVVVNRMGCDESGPRS